MSNERQHPVKHETVDLRVKTRRLLYSQIMDVFVCAFAFVSATATLCEYKYAR